MSSPPQEVEDGETIVRCICSPYHLDKRGALHWKAFQPRSGSAKVSVIRHGVVGSNFCKERGKELSDPSADKVYSGLAAILALSIRSAGAEVEDAPQDFPGHAHIDHQIEVEPYRPLAPHVLEVLRDRCKALKSIARYYSDPDPDAQGWTGPDLRQSQMP